MEEEEVDEETERDRVDFWVCGESMRGERGLMEQYMVVVMNV